jgi:exonuclease III
MGEKGIPATSPPPYPHSQRKKRYTPLLFLILVYLCTMHSNYFSNENLTISCINCNSLNMSNSAKWNQCIKIYGIAKLKSDIIFLSDVRLSNKNLVSASDDVSKLFLNNPYEKYVAFFNSSKNKRGVGILIKNSLQAEVLRQIRSEDENILLLEIRIKGTVCACISIYGPNNNDPLFFETLNRIINSCDVPVIAGGDWNCTYSSSPLEQNIDCLNMRRPPNLNHSNKLEELCNTHDMSDPFRFLYPDKLEFTYVPRTPNAINKSRLDYFIISDCLLDSVSDCVVAPNVQSKLFDHKAVEINFNKPVPVGKKTLAISNKELDDDLLEYLVAATLCETYLIHSLEVRLGRFTTEELLGFCGRTKALIRQCGPPLEYIIGLEITQNIIVTRANCLTRLQILKNSLNIPEVENIQLNCDPDVFFETLMLNLKNEVISHQSFMRKKKFEKIENLKKEIIILKDNYILNENLILEKELLLNNMVDIEMRQQLSRHKNFELINDEKMTPRFLTLARVSKKNESLDVICDNNGLPFESKPARDDYIRGFYENIYTQNENVTPLDENCINDFLGLDICNNNVVRNSKLTDDDMNFFDRDLTLNELDIAMQNMNENSAGGADGVGTKFLKKFWAYIRIPLHRYAIYSLNKGSLTQSFNSALIKLIPKKGNLKQIKNWRPISLLNCVFKIISKAIDSRLQKICDKILSRGQKGFTSKRFIHECIINICETAAYCETNNIPSFILALDMAKAFDTVRQDFMDHVYKFFGIGERFRKMLNTITINRFASIILEDGQITKPFKLGTGFPQGNNPSPKQFNMIAQIFIFKVEFDPRIQPVRLPAPQPPLPRVDMQQPDQDVNGGENNGGEYGKLECNRATEKVEAFADDNTILGKNTPEALPAIRTILNDFAAISGLKCNIEKSNVMFIGMEGADPDPGPVPQHGRTDEPVIVSGLGAGPDPLAERAADPVHQPAPPRNSNGFPIVDKLTILGFELTKNHKDLTGNFNKVIQKIGKIANFWSRFRLSLPGRLNIAKCLMLSQVSYIGTIVKPEPEQLDNMQNLISNFVKGNLRISKQNINTSVEKGGIEMIDLQEFITGLHCSWFKRSYNSKIDGWRTDLNRVTGENVLTADPRLIDASANPVLFELTQSFWEFKKAFYLQNSNFLLSYLIGNPLLIDNRANKMPVDINLFLNADRSNVQAYGLKISDILNNHGNLVTRQELSDLLGCNLTEEKYRAITRSVNESRQLVQKMTFQTGMPCTSLENFVKRFKKGSRPFRRALVVCRESKIKCKTKTNIKTFFRLIDIEIPDESTLKLANSQWSNRLLPNKIREFNFKFRNNVLGINTRVSHFNQNIRRGCTFCTISHTNPVPDESFLHLFFDCPAVNNIFQRFFNSFLPELNLDSIVKKKKFLFTGINPLSNKIDNFFLELLSITLAWYIWECKLQKKQPVYSGLLNEVFFTMDKMVKFSGKLRDAMTINLTLFRVWNAEIGFRR